jgi:hypothetical protein
MTTKRSDTDFDLCQFEYSDGRYCGLPSVREFNGLCRAHGQLKKSRQSAPAENNDYVYLEPFTNDPPSEAEVHSALSVVFRSLAADRISNRRAATLGYLGQLLLMKQCSKQDRENLSNLSRAFVKTIEYAYHPKYRTAAGNPPQSQSANPSTPNPASQRSS